MQYFRPHIVGLGGALRCGSASETALRASLLAASDAGARITVFTGADLSFPFYSADEPARPAEIARLLAAIRDCDGVIISSPAYHGTISGLIKNALDYFEDLRTDRRPYLEGLPVGCIVCAAGPQAAVHTLSTLRSIAHSLRGWPTPLGASIGAQGRIFDEDGKCLHPAYEQQLIAVGQQVVKFARVHAHQRS